MHVYFADNPSTLSQTNWEKYRKEYSDAILFFLSAGTNTSDTRFFLAPVKANKESLHFSDLKLKPESAANYFDDGQIELLHDERKVAFIKADSWENQKISYYQLLDSHSHSVATTFFTEHSYTLSTDELDRTILLEETLNNGKVAKTHYLYVETQTDPTDFFYSFQEQIFTDPAEWYGVIVLDLLNIKAEQLDSFENKSAIQIIFK